MSVALRSTLCILLLMSLTITAPVKANEYSEGLMEYAGGNFNSALQHFKTAVKNGESGAKYMLMRMYSEGKVKDASKAEVFYWTKATAMEGLAQAQFALAELYAGGTGTEKNLKSAFDWYNKAARQGHHVASERLGDFYQTGTVVATDTNTAKRLYLYAASEYDVYAQKGHADSQFAMGNMYEQGKGVNKNIEMAIVWYRRSAMQNHAQAQLNIGKLLANGSGVEQNVGQAAYWLKKAAAQGMKAANRMLKQLEHRHGSSLAYK